jgi:hypothetical protein
MSTVIPKWSEILDQYEVTIDAPDYQPVWFMMDAAEEHPIYDIHSEGVEFLIVADTRAELEKQVEAIIPSALQGQDTFAFQANWAFMRNTYRALNYNGKRITVAQTKDGISQYSAVNLFQKTLVPTLSHWFTTIYTSKDGNPGILSRKVDDVEYAIVTDSADEMLALLIRTGQEEIAMETMQIGAVTLASMNYTKILTASQGIYYRGETYKFADILEEIHACVKKLTDQTATLELVEGMQKLITGRDGE